MARLQHPPPPLRLRHHHAPVLHPQPHPRPLQPRRPRILPHRLHPPLSVAHASLPPVPPHSRPTPAHQPRSHRPTPHLNSRPASPHPPPGAPPAMPHRSQSSPRRATGAGNPTAASPARSLAGRLPSPDKPLDRMDRLADMAHFPPLVNAGATANILLTLVATYFVESWLLGGPLAPFAPASVLLPAPLVWTALVLALNLTPVLLLRARDRTRAAAGHPRPMPRLRDMDFLRDQHRFSDWVYLAASANMAFWILVGWTAFTLRHTIPTLLATLAVAFLATFSPILLRRTRP